MGMGFRRRTEPYSAIRELHILVSVKWSVEMKIRNSFLKTVEGSQLI